jgi:hypothetical protein
MKMLSILSILAIAPTITFAEAITWTGDFRFRHERIDQQSNTTHYEKYNQERFILRLGAASKPAENVAIEARLATGTGGTSTMQTFNDTTANSNKNYDFKLDRANLVYTAVENLDLTAGRMAVKFNMAGGSDMLWDADENLDGLHLGYSYNLGSFDLGLNVGSFQIVQDRTKLAKESSLQAYQLVGKTSVGENKIILSTGIYNFGNLSQVNLATNTNAGVDYKVFDSGLEVKIPTSIPFAVFADYAKNIAGKTADKADAMMFGVKVSTLKDPGSWSLTYDYRKVEKFATPGLYTDGDAFYNGWTDGKNHRVKAAYQLNTAMSLGANYISGKSTISTAEKNYTKLQFDVVAKF